MGWNETENKVKKTGGLHDEPPWAPSKYIRKFGEINRVKPEGVDV